MISALALSLLAQTTPAGSGTNCDRDPSVVKQADPVLPKGYLSHVSGNVSAVVAVTLDQSGAVKGATIYKSSGDATMDSAAVAAAKQSTYAPGEANCKPAGGMFGVEISFAGDGPAAVSDTDCPRDARVAGVVSVAWPNGTRVYGSGGVTVTVDLDIAPDGSLESARIVQSSGNMALDQAALAAARQSTYLPKLVEVRRQAKAGESPAEAKSCVAVKGKYLFRVTFDPNS